MYVFICLIESRKYAFHLDGEIFLTIFYCLSLFTTMLWTFVLITSPKPTVVSLP